MAQTILSNVESLMDLFEPGLKVIAVENNKPYIRPVANDEFLRLVENDEYSRIEEKYILMISSIPDR